MSPAERTLWRQLQRLASQQQPDLARALLQGYAVIRAALSDAQLVALIAAGDTFGALRLLDDALLDRAFGPYRAAIFSTTTSGVVTYARTVPNVQRLGITFNVLNPQAVEVVRTLNAKLVGTLKEDVRETVRQAIARDVLDGVNPRVTARRVRAAIGLGPAQEQQVANFRAALERGDTAKAFTYARRDKRFDRTITKGELTPAQIDKMTDTYRKRRIALNAEANTRTAALDAMRQSQKLAWDEAVASGAVRAQDLRRRWVTNIDGRERRTHATMNRVVVLYEEPFDVPGEGAQLIPGALSWGCRCSQWIYDSTL